MGYGSRLKKRVLIDSVARKPHASDAFWGTLSGSDCTREHRDRLQLNCHKFHAKMDLKFTRQRYLKDKRICSTRSLNLGVRA